MKKGFVVYPLFALLFVVGVAWTALQQSPVALLNSISVRMIAKLEKNKSRLGQRSVVNRIVRTTLLPYVDLNYMSSLVVGPNYWHDASSEQKKAFKDEFVRIVISTYSSAISSYNGDRVLFYPLRGGYSGHKIQLGNKVRSIIRVRSVIARRNRRRISVNYLLIEAGNSWRVFDFSVENVSIVQSYRAQFAGVLANSGMEGLIQQLERHRRKIR